MPNDDNEIEEYDFASMGTPVRGKHVEKYERYLRTVELDDRLAARFPDSQSVLEALRQIADNQPTQ